jgi:hypothetical protein
MLGESLAGASPPARLPLREQGDTMRAAFTVCAVSLSLLSGPSHSFDVDGYRSGMPLSELRAIAERRGLIVLGDDSDNTYRFLNPITKTVDGPFVVCPSRGLTSYLHKIDFDAEYTATLERFLREYGQPVTKVLHYPWPFGGNMNLVWMTWLHKGEETVLEMNTDARDGQGKLRYTRDAAVRDTVLPRGCAK